MTMEKKYDRMDEKMDGKAGAGTNAIKVLDRKSTRLNSSHLR